MQSIDETEAIPSEVTTKLTSTEASPTNQPHLTMNPPTHPSKSKSPQELLYIGKWTREEEEYVDGLMENFLAGNLSDIPDGTGMRFWLAKMLSCRVKRISKHYEGSGYNGRAKYHRDRKGNLSNEESARMTKKLEEQRLAFLASRHRIMQGLAGTRKSSNRRVAHAPTGCMFSKANKEPTAVAVVTASPAPASSVIQVQNNNNNNLERISFPSSPASSNLTQEMTVNSQPAVIAPPSTLAPASQHDLLLCAALIQNLAATAPASPLASNPAAAAPPLLPPVANPVSSLLAQALRVRQQIEWNNRNALLQRALHNHLLATMQLGGGSVPPNSQGPNAA